MMLLTTAQVPELGRGRLDAPARRISRLAGSADPSSIAPAITREGSFMDDSPGRLGGLPVMVSAMAEADAERRRVRVILGGGEAHSTG
jgi:hypothetical protein